MTTQLFYWAGILRLALKLCSFTSCGVYVAYVFLAQSPAYKNLYSNVFSGWSLAYSHGRVSGVSLLDGKALTTMLFLWVPLLISSFCVLLYHNISKCSLEFKSVVNIVAKLRRFLGRPTPPRQFWFDWCGGLTVGDFMLVKFWVVLNASYLINLMSRYLAKIDSDFASKAMPDPRWLYVLERLAFSFGVMMGPNLLLLFLPVPHSSFLNTLTGVPHAHMIKYHRWLGHGTMCVLTVHGSLFYIYWSVKGGWWMNATNWGTLHAVNNLAGSLAYLCGLVLWLSAATWVRRRFYEVFFRFHMVCFLGFFLLAHIHYSGNYKYFVPGLLLYAVDLVLRAGQLSNVTTVTAASVKPGGGLATMELPVGQGLSCCPLRDMYLMFPSISRWQWHPFTVAGTSPGGGLVFHIKKYGKFTQRLMAALAAGEPLPVRVSGPVGNDSRRREWEGYSSMVFLGGGVGVNPLLSILRHMVRQRRGQEGPSWGVESPRVHFIWVCRHMEEFTTLGEELLTAARDSSGWLTVSLYHTGSSSSHQELELSVSVKDSLLSQASTSLQFHPDSDSEASAEAPDAPFFFKSRAPFCQTLCRRIQPATANDLHLAWVQVLVFVGAFCAQYLAGWFSAQHAVHLVSVGIYKETGFQWKVGLLLGVLQPILALGTPFLLAILPFNLWRYWKAKRAVQQGQYSQIAELAHPWSCQHALVARECVVRGDRVCLPGSDLEAEVQQGRPDIQEALLAAAKGSSTVGVYVGGPESFTRMVTLAVAELNDRASNAYLELHNEVSIL